LLAVARSAFPSLSLWTFQRNRAARNFYEAKGFVLVSQTDGSGNDEKQPDALYTWPEPPDGRPIALRLVKTIRLHRG
jgi:hypothetical protein